MDRLGILIPDSDEDLNWHAFLGHSIDMQGFRAAEFVGVDRLTRSASQFVPRRQRGIGVPELAGPWDLPAVRRHPLHGTLAFRPDGTEAALVFQCKKDAYSTESLIELLQELHRPFPGENGTLIWDGLPSHRSKAMKAWLTTQRWLLVEQLPDYAHDPQPVELVWGNVKNVELAHLCPDTGLSL